MQLHLEVTESLSDKAFVGLDITGFENTGKYRPISRVTLMVDNENVYTAGDDTGLELTASCPHATQEMVNSLLDKMKGYQYQSFTADAANLDPAAELGDGITVNGIYSVISKLDDDGIGFPDISAPGEADLEEEYPSDGPMTQEFNRKISETRSQIIKTAEEIRLEVENEVKGLSAEFTVRLGEISAELRDEINGLSSTLNIKIDGIEASLTDEINGLSASINLQIDSITSTVQGQGGQISQIQQTVSSINTQITGINGDISSLEQTASSLRTQISNAQGDISSLEQLVDSITLSVSNGSTSSTIQLKAGSATISSQTIQMNGLVTFTGLSSGTTTINGACIKTGLIDADRLNLTGAITFGDLSTAVQNDIENAIYTSNAAQSSIDRWSYSGTTYIDGSRIMTGTVSASILEGGQIRLLDGSGQPAGLIDLAAASSYGGQKVMLESGAIELNSRAGDIFIRSGSYGTYLQLKDDVFVGNGDLAPHSSGAQSCGTSARRWSEVYVSTSEITTSDRNLKNNINYELSAYDSLFSALKPCGFQYNNGKSGRTHLGLIAQDVEESLEAVGLTSLDFAGFVKSPVEEADGGYVYSLRYEEFIALCIRQIQLLIHRVDALEGE